MLSQQLIEPPSREPALPEVYEDSPEPSAHSPRDLPRIGTFAVIVMVALFLTLLGGLFLLGYLPHRKLQADLRAEAETVTDARPVASVVTPERQVRAVVLSLPADVQPFQQTAVFARTNGYLKKLMVDIGDRVKEGQLLTQIDTPEVDAQLKAARAALEEAEANLERANIDFTLGQTTLDRYEGFAKTGGVTQQQLDERRTQFNQTKATLAGATASRSSAKAEIQRLEALQSFENVTAPFDGVISARNYDVGALLAPSNAASGKPLFRIDRTDTLRVFVNVPQVYATEVRPGQKAQLTVRNYPNRTFEGEVTRSAGTMDAATRTLRVEVDVANADGVLIAGMYGQVRFEVMQTEPPVMVPTSALIFDAQGLKVGIVQAGKVHFQTITTGRDLGTVIEVLTGLSGNEQVIANPGELLREGTEVQVIRAPASGSTTRPAKSGATDK